MTGIILVLFVSCKKPEKFGFDDDELSLAFVDDFAVSAKTILMDSVYSNNFNSMLIGAYHDPLFGAVQASSFFQLRMPEIQYNLGINPVFKSARLVLGTADAYRQDGSSYQYKLELRQLNTSLNSTSNYLTSEQVGYGADDLLTESDRTLLEPTFGTQLMWAIDSATQSDFDAEIGGIALVPDLTSTSAVLRYNLSGNDSTSTHYIEIKYDYQDTTGGPYLPGEYKLYLDQNATHFTHISSDRSGTPLAGLTSIGDEITGDVSYVQAGIAIGTRFSFPEFETFFEGKQNVAFNRIEITADIEEADYDVPGKMALVGAEDFRVYAFSDLKDNQYSFEGTEVIKYFQNMHDNSEYQDLIFIPATNEGVERATLNSATEDAIKIKLYYSEFQ